jgi:hypothetical protein
MNGRALPPDTAIPARVDIVVSSVDSNLYAKKVYGKGTSGIGKEEPGEEF